MLNVVSLYGIHPIDLQSTAAVPRLNAQLLTLLAAGRTDWDFLAVSPAAKALPGVEAVAIPLSLLPTVKLRVWEPHISRRILRPKAHTIQSYSKSVWAEAAAVRLAGLRPDRPSTVVICTHSEAVLAVRRAMPKARIIHWLHTPGSVDAGLVADAAVAVSAGVYRYTWSSAGHRYPPPMWIIPNWIDTEEFRPPSPLERGEIRDALGLQEQDLVLAFVGRHWLKGAQVIERALAALPLGEKRVVLLSAGERRNERRTLAAGREVWNLGLLQPTQLRRIYHAADIGVVPSVSEETAPLAALEMMACGLPVIASRVGGLPELIEEGITGQLVDLPNSVDSWVELTAELLADPEARSKMSQAAQTSVHRRFQPERALEDWTRVISAIMANT